MPGMNATQYDFCEELPSSIAGRIFAHSGPECDWDNPEILLGGVTVELRNAQGQLIRTTTTNADGEYRFDNLEHGEYQVRELQPAGYFDGEERVGTAGGVLSGIDSIVSINLHAGTNATQYDFCEELPSSIAGRIFAHSGPECDWDNPEVRLAGVKVELRNEHGHVIATTTTNANGEYRFDNLEHGVVPGPRVPAGRIFRWRRARRHRGRRSGWQRYDT